MDISFRKLLKNSIKNDMRERQKIYIYREREIESERETKRDRKRDKIKDQELESDCRISETQLQ